MNICLGNLTIKEIEDRLGVQFPEDIKSFMLSTHSPNAKVAHGTWHCFDIPFVLVCADYETAKTIYEGVKHLHNECKVPLAFSIQPGDPNDLHN